MIHDLRYAVSFPTNGVSLNGQLSFQPGSTAISGQNGTGKSFIAEMIRYGLFGKKALRGPASDYKTLDMSLTFSVGDQDYIVARGKKEMLTDDPDGDPIAVGADAVNKKIIEILGFGLEVFDVVCAANQKESERLTRLTPAKRKELIDDVVGLTAQEAVEKACREESKGLAREAEALSNVLVVPIEPEEPEDYRPSAAIAAELNETKELIAKRDRLQRIIDAVGEEPEEPAEPRPDLAALEAHEEERKARDVQRAALERQLAGIPEAKFTAEELDAADALAEYDAEIIRRGPEPNYDLVTLDHFEAALEAQDRATEAATCPKCDHVFHPGLNPQQEALLLVASPLNRAQIASQRARHVKWASALEEPEGNRLTTAERTEGRMALAMAKDKPALLKELVKFTLLPDRSAELAAARRLDREWDIFEAEEDRYNERLGASLEAQAELDHLPVPARTVAELDAAFVASRVYETQLTNYSEQKQRFDELTAQIAETQERAEAFAVGAKGLVEARRTLKAFLAPSLSRVATHLIQQMTVNAKRPLSVVTIDEDMNIFADGQDVSTFNGAHATMINLALRLALGQVLVSRVFPVFIGDEIDSDADEGNSQAIADALSACKDQLKQIVLISHKRLEGVDHEVTL